MSQVCVMVNRIKHQADGSTVVTVSTNSTDERKSRKIIRGFMPMVHRIETVAIYMTSRLSEFTLKFQPGVSVPEWKVGEIRG